MRIKLLVTILLLAVFMNTVPVSATAQAEPEGFRIAVASDLHLDPNNTQKGPDATAVQYNMELVDALLWDARQQGAELILLTGDLVNGGKTNRHEALTRKLKSAEESGLDVYVLPGNHDLGPVTQTEFAALYADFGYAEAYSRDHVSLSYCVVRDSLMILMMDTAGYSTNAIDLAEAPGTDNAFLRRETLRWAEEMLMKAKADGLHVLCAGHYNLLPEISRQEGSGYHIQNGEAFTELLRAYGVTLYLSGHMHLRAVYQEDGLTELLTEYLLAYPTGYGLLDLTDSQLQYRPRRIDVDAWAAANEQDDPVLLQYTDWQEKNFRAYADENVAYMSKRNPIKKKEQKQAAEFFYTAMSAYWDGCLSAKKEELKAMPGYEPFFRCAEGYAYGWWLKDLIETAVPELAGFEQNW